MNLKRRQNRKHINFFIKMLIALQFIVGCSSSDLIQFTKAQSEIENGNFRTALSYLDLIVRKSKTKEIGIKAMREAARISFFEIKDFKAAEKYYKLLVLHSPDDLERVDAQKQIAAIYFDHITDYQQAISEYGRLLEMPHSAYEEVEYRTKIARAYYYQSNFFQAKSEVDELLTKKPKDEFRFDLMMLKANILMAMKETDQAISLLELITRENPERSDKENVNILIAVNYEEKKEFKRAIEVLEQALLKSKNKEFIEIRLDRLKSRLINAPGAKGLKK